MRAVPGRPSSLIGIPFDRPVVGYGGKTINTLRLWAAAAPDYFDFQAFSSGDFVGALAETLAAESLTRVLYPDDSTSMGQGLRFVQEYFLVACSLADLVRRFRRSNADWSALPEKVAIQLNDTHPALAVPELMRILLDDAQPRMGPGLGPHPADAGLHQSHAAARGPGEVAARAGSRCCCRATWRSSTRSTAACSTTVRTRFPGDEERVARVSLIEEGAERKIRMANLAIVGSHSTNGVAAIHSELLRTTTVKDLAEMFPERFNNKTNGVTPRRWLLLANPALAQHDHRGHRRRLDHRPRASCASSSRWPTTGAFATPSARPSAQAKTQFADWLKATTGQTVDPDTHLRLPGQAHPRIQAATAQRAAHRRALQPPAREPEPRDAAADVLLRRQGGAGLPPGQAHHQVHQQPGRHDRRRPGGARTDSRSCSCPNTACRWPSG